MTRETWYQKERTKKLAFWEPHLRLWQESKLGPSHYCKENNLNLSTFTYWRYIVLGKPPAKPLSVNPPATLPVFLEIKALEKPCMSSPTPLKIETPRGIKVFFESFNLEQDLQTILKISE